MSLFAQRLKELREERGISRKQLADAMIVSVRLVSYWENGQRECNFETLIKLSKYFNESIDYLLGNSQF